MEAWRHACLLRGAVVEGVRGGSCVLAVAVLTTAGLVVVLPWVVQLEGVDVDVQWAREGALNGGAAGILDLVDDVPNAVLLQANIHPVRMPNSPKMHA